MQEFTNLGLLQLPSCQHLKSAHAKEALLKAKASGELRLLQSAVRAGRLQLGPEDPLVRKVGRLLSKAERCVRTCRDCLPHDSLRELPASMGELQQVILQLKMSGLGPRLWDEPLLAFSRDRVSQWRLHQPAIEDLLGKLHEGSAPFCAAWAELALGESDIKMDFGAAVTKELLLLPDAGPVLVASLEQAVKRLPEAAEDEYEFTILRLMRISSLLSTVDKSALDLMLLKRDDSGRTAFSEAAAQSDSVVFYAMYQSLSCELLTISPTLQQRIEQVTTTANALPASVTQRAAQWLAEQLGVRAADLVIQRLPPAGLAVHLFPETGVQPTARRAQELLGSGALAGFVGRPSELDRWSKHHSISRPYGDVARCRSARDRLAADKETLRQATADDVAARADVVAAEAEFSRCTAWIPAAEQEVKDAQEWELKTMGASREAMMQGSDEEAEAARKVDDEAQVRHQKAKQDVAASKEGFAASKAWKERAAVTASTCAAAFQAARASEEEATAEASTAAKLYKATMQGPVQGQAAHPSVSTNSAPLG